MDWGMQRRMSQLIREDGHCMYLPIDHGYFQGPTTNLEKPGDTVAPLMEYCDALFATRGVLRSCIDPATTKPVNNLDLYSKSVDSVRRETPVRKRLCDVRQPQSLWPDRRERFR